MKTEQHKNLDGWIKNTLIIKDWLLHKEHVEQISRDEQERLGYAICKHRAQVRHLMRRCLRSAALAEGMGESMGSDLMIDMPVSSEPGYAISYMDAP